MVLKDALLKFKSLSYEKELSASVMQKTGSMCHIYFKIYNLGAFFPQHNLPSS